MRTSATCLNCDLGRGLLPAFLLALAASPPAPAQEGLSVCALPEDPLRAESDAAPGANLYFPNEGRINALLVFVQHKDDYGDDASTTDPVTEWPSTWSRGADRRLPTWGPAQLALPGTHPDGYAEGSLSHYYRTVSGGRFKLEGYVYPEVYIPQQNQGWYHPNRGSFPNGQVRLSHEVISYVNQNPEGIPFEELDRWQNGTADASGPNNPDGRIDMVILVFRANDLPTMGINVSGAGATRYEKLGRNYLAMVYVASMMTLLL